MNTGTFEGQRHQIAMKLESQAVVRHHKVGAGTESESSARAAHSPNC